MKGYDRPIPAKHQLAGAMWKCHRNAIQGVGDGSVTWWTLQPVERMWWIRTAEEFRDAVARWPELLDEERRTDTSEERHGC